MRSFFALFFNRPPSIEMTLDDWSAFQGSIQTYLLWSVLIGAIVIGTLYAFRCRAFVIREPADPFRAFTPMGWFGLAIVPGLVVGATYFFGYRAKFAEAAVEPGPGATGAVLAGTMLTLLVVQVASWIPGVTPRKVLYHPRWPWQLFNRKKS